MLLLLLLLGILRWTDSTVIVGQHQIVVQPAVQIEIVIAARVR